MCLLRNSLSYTGQITNNAQDFAAKRKVFLEVLKSNRLPTVGQLRRDAPNETAWSA